MSAERKHHAKHILRVKIKSLAEEARIIRSECARAKSKHDKNDMHLHRTGIVRSESRKAQLAYAAIRGVPYSVVESKVNNHWIRQDPTSFLLTIEKQILRSSDGHLRLNKDSELLQWFQDAKKHLKSQGVC